MSAKHTIEITLGDDGSFKLDNITGKGKQCRKVADELADAMELTVDTTTRADTAELHRKVDVGVTNQAKQSR